jgi:hypothetical protein
MATQVTFEYVDDSGTVRRVDDIRKVPKKFVRRMLAVGTDAPEAGQPPPAASVAAPPAFPMKLHDLGGGVSAEALIALALCIVFLKSSNFVVRCLIALLGGFWLFAQGYNAFMKSDLSKTYDPDRGKAAAAPVEEPGRIVDIRRGN